MQSITRHIVAFDRARQPVLLLKTCSSSSVAFCADAWCENMPYWMDVHADAFINSLLSACNASPSQQHCFRTSVSSASACARPFKQCYTSRCC